MVESDSTLTADDGADEGEGAKKHYRQILEEQIGVASAELRRSTAGLLFSGLSAGLDIGFGPLLMAVGLTLMGGDPTDPATHLLVANLYAVGFIFVILGRSELFTEHTTLAVLPVLAGRATYGELGRLWGLVYVSNLVGALAFSAMGAFVGPALGAADPSAFVHFARELVDHPWHVILAGGVLAGWLMGLLSWLVTAGRDTVSQILFVWLVTLVIGLAGLHHSIAGSVEVLLGVMSGLSDAPGVGDFATFLLWATVGNAIGGFVFVAILKYAHARADDDE